MMCSELEASKPTWSTNGFAFVGWPNWDWVRWAVSRKQTPVASKLFMSGPGCYTCHRSADISDLCLLLTLCWQNSVFTSLWRCWLFPGLFTNEWAGNQPWRPACLCTLSSCNWYYAIIVTGLGWGPCPGADHQCSGHHNTPGFHPIAQ